jgi:hypothetical protein
MIKDKIMEYKYKACIDAELFFQMHTHASFRKVSMHVF